MNLSDHETHNLKRNAGTRMLEHLEESQRGDVNLFRGVCLIHVDAWPLLLPAHPAHAACAKKLLQIHFKLLTKLL